MVASEERDYVTVAEAAKELSVSPATVWRWIAAERLPAYRVGARKIRIKRWDLERVVQPVRRGTTDPVGTRKRPMTIAEWQARTPPTPEELAKRQEVVARTLANSAGRSVAPLTTADLIRQVREEREERYRSWLDPSS